MNMPDTRSISNDTAMTLDEVQILHRLDGDWQLLADLCDLSLAELPRMLEPLVSAVRLEEANVMNRAAHRLKGALSIFGPGPHIDTLEALEAMGRNHDIVQTPEVLSRFERLLDEFSAAVAALGKEAHARASRR
jgi:hypothetical protein